MATPRCSSLACLALSPPQRRRRSALARLSGWLAACALLSMGGCQVLINGELGEVRCAPGAEGSAGPPACPQGFLCTQGTCVNTAGLTSRLGAFCARDEDCDRDDLCLNPELFGGAGESVCARPCCSSSDCDPQGGFVCWSSKIGGGNFCRAATSVGREPPGSGLTGTACSANTECRSGVCDPSGECVDTCCSDATCSLSASGAQCRVWPTALAEGGSVWTCGAPPGTKKVYEVCAGDDDCASGLCEPLGDLGSRCVAPCCASPECGSVDINGSFYPVACTDITHYEAIVRACAKLLEPGAVKATGASCVMNDECRGGKCIPIGEGDDKTYHCSDTCCSDASCGSVALACTPYPLGASQALRCEPR